MAKFRKKPVVIEAVQFFDNMISTCSRLPDGVEIMYFVDPPMEGRVKGYHPVIKTLEGPLLVSDGDWIITGIKGERYACKPDIFADTYEKA